MFEIDGGWIYVYEFKKKNISTCNGGTPKHQSLLCDEGVYKQNTE